MMVKMQLLQTLVRVGPPVEVLDIGHIIEVPAADVPDMTGRGIAILLEHDHPEKDEARAPRKRVAK
jgi:hypothetical protein